MCILSPFNITFFIDDFSNEEDELLMNAFLYDGNSIKSYSLYDYIRESETILRWKNKTLIMEYFGSENDSGDFNKLVTSKILITLNFRGIFKGFEINQNAKSINH